MNHNYKIKDFKKPEFESDTDLADISVTVCLRNPLELPSVLEKRLEDIINNLIGGEKIYLPFGFYICRYNKNQKNRCCYQEAG